MILMGKRELVALPSLSSWCLLIVVWLLIVVPRVCRRFVIVVIPDHSHLLLIMAANGVYMSQLKPQVKNT